MDRWQQHARQLVVNSKSNVEGLIRLFEHNAFPGQSAHGRLRWVLRVTAAGYPGMQMGLFPPDDSGFKPELTDGRFYTDPAYWADFVEPEKRKTKQVGHFLTAAGLCCNRWPDWAKLRLIVGHEKRGDHLFFTFLWQFLKASHRDIEHFLEAVARDRAGDPAGRDAALRRIWKHEDEAVRDPRRIGNSLPDLRLSVKGWRLGDEIKCGALDSRQAVADWLRREVYDPTRTRQGAARRPEPSVPEF